MKKTKMKLHTALSHLLQHGKIIKKTSKLCVFPTGSVIIDLSGESQRISFLPEQIYHGTSEPWNTPCLPEVLTGSKSSKSILKKQQEILKFISNSMLVWVNWNHADCQSR